MDFIPYMMLVMEIVDSKWTVLVRKKLGFPCLHYYNVKNVTPMIADKMLHAFMSIG
jgi:DNA-binding HxlR family transcriptional regulator